MNKKQLYTWLEEGRRRLKLAGDTLLLVTIEPLLGFMKDDGFQKAGMLAYYTFMSFIPLLLALILVGSRLISSEQAVRMVENLVGQLVPQSKDLVLREVTGLAEQKAWSLVSIVVLFWLMMPVASVLRVTLASIFKTSIRVFKGGGPLSFILGKLYDMGSLLLIVTMMGLLTGTGWLENAIHRIPGSQWVMLRTLMNFGITNLATFACLYVFYFLFVPDRRKPMALLTGTLVAAVLLKLMNPVFTLMLQFNPDYGYMFGSLKAIFLFFIWIYYASMCILFGAEVMSCLYRRRELVLREQVKRLLSGGDASRGRYHHLAQTYIRPLVKGQVVFSQGDPSDEMFIIVRGRLAMVKDGQVVAVMEKGRAFGEVGALLGLPRTADARVESEEAEVVALSPGHLSDPDLLIGLLRDMAGRLAHRPPADLTGPADAGRA